jgi:hypothetical protein
LRFEGLTKISIPGGPLLFCLTWQVLSLAFRHPSWQVRFSDRRSSVQAGLCFTGVNREFFREQKPGSLALIIKRRLWILIRGVFWHLRLPLGHPLLVRLDLFGGPGELHTAVGNARQRKEFGGLEHGDLVLGVGRIRGCGSQGGNGFVAAKLPGGFDGRFPNLFFGTAQVSQDIGQIAGVAARGPFLEAVGFGFNGGLMLFGGHDIGRNRRGRGRRGSVAHDV